MQATLSPSDVRQLFVEQFRQYGVAEAQAEAPAETILIRDGRYRGRSYRTEGLLAMWMIEIGLVQFYAEDGSMLATISLYDRPSSQRAAA